ncbi:hypothetical protein [Dactylosporangium sp. NPDC006015]|uniref:hypothetical protein n=1 Tax=Dactylosporangium sp. NPDC006015 TaxID=3154576 RepID=UPI0033AA0229
MLKLTKAGAAASPAAGTAANVAAQDAAATANDGDTDGTAITLGVFALIAGLAGLFLGVLAYRRAGRTG